MGSRSDWLTDFAKPIADDLAAQAGSLKHILSAGVMALKGCTAEQREYYMAKAVGREIAIEPDENKLARVLIEILKGGDFGLNHEDIELIESFRRVLAVDISERELSARSSQTKARHKGPKAG